MNIEEIVKAWLEANGYDGLANDECGCDLDDLMPCDEPYATHCVAGHKVPCNCPDGDCEWIYCWQHGWHMVPGKKEAER